MPVLGNAAQTNNEVQRAIYNGVARMKIKRNDNGTYIGEFHYDSNLEDPTQDAADAAIAKVLETLQQNAQVVYVRSGDTEYEVRTA